MFKDSEHHKAENILTYRDQAHRSNSTGTVAPIHHTPWMKALDELDGSLPQSARHQAGG